MGRGYRGPHLLVPDHQMLVDNFQSVLFANVVVTHLQDLSKAALSYAPNQGEVCKREMDPVQEKWTQLNCLKLVLDL